MKKIPLIWTSLLVCISLIGIWLYVAVMPMVTSVEGVTYYLKPGISKKGLITELSEQGIIPHSFLFSLYTYPHKSAQLKTGEYLFPKGSTIISIWRQVTTGTFPKNFNQLFNM